MTSIKKLKTDNIESIVNWLEFNIEELKARLIICRTDDSYIKGALSLSKKIADDLDNILKLWKNKKDNPAKFTVELMAICDRSQNGTMPKKKNLKIAKHLN